MFRALAAFLLLTLAHFCSATEPSPIPLDKGTQWFYEASVKWTPMASRFGPRGVQHASFKWTAEVVECFASNGVRAAVVHAWPDETAGMDPAKPTDYTVLLHTSNRLYSIARLDRKHAIDTARRLVLTRTKLPPHARVYLELPLTLHQRWGEEPADLTREDGWYCWHVENKEQKNLRITGVSNAKADVYTVAYRTNPDHQLMQIVPAVGIVAFQFEHHGTVASADVRLVRFKR